MTASAAGDAYAWAVQARRCAPGDARPVVLVAPDGARLVGDYRPARGPVRAAVLGLHSFGDYRRAFATLGARLARCGIATLAFDQRGFGASTDHGRWSDDDDAYRRDVIGAVGALEGMAPGAPVFAIGEGMGAAAALVAAPSLGDRLAGLVLVNPTVRRGQPLRSVLDVLIFGAAALAPSGCVRLTRRARWGHPEAAARLARDPLVVRAVRADTVAGCVRLANAATAAAVRVTQPALVYFGARDGLIAAPSIRALAADLRGCVTLQIDAEAPHLPLQALTRDAVFAEILSWLDARLRAFAPQAAGPAVLDIGALGHGRRHRPRDPPLALAPPHA